MPPPSNTELGARLSDLERRFQQKVESNDPSEPGLMLRVDRMEQADASRGRIFRWATGGSLAGLIALLYVLLKGKGGGGP